MPVYLLRSSGVERIREALGDMFHVSPSVASASRSAADDVDDTDDEDESDE